MRAWIPVLLTAVAFAQAPVAFEVASIHPHQGAIQRIGVSTDGTQVVIHASTIRDMVVNAYDLKPYQLEGATGWMVSDTDRYDITARVAGENEPPFSQVRLMMQNLLAERFEFRFHRETREMSVYALVAGKTAPKLTRSDSLYENVNFKQDGQQTQLNFRGGRMEFLAQQLTRMPGMERPVLDQTGIAGKFDFDLKLSTFRVSAAANPEAAPVTGPSGESIFTAVEEQLGLRLEPRKAAVEVLVIDRVSRPSEN